MNQEDSLAKGIQLCKEEKYEEAIGLFNNLLIETPENTNVLYNRAKAYSRTGKFKQAVSDFDKIVELTNSPSMISERALAHFLNQNTEAAMKDLDLAAELDPENPYRYSSRAFIKDRLGDLEGAIKDYNKAIELDPDDAISYNNKGLVEEKLGRKEAAKKSFTKADHLADGKPSAIDAPTKQVSQPKTPENKPTIKSNKADSKSKPKMKFTDFLNTTKSIISDKKERADFFDFIRSLGKK
ncbi:tetratricopeptide repeat protein [Marinigracilibium pacificum]|uniref:Tetratricopeptide repeat protein n=1 Tax=Marinigracilibium pacificum TaxID=2729599 RepID=A0A848J423_9BACT|nr:tetratricopeptide repeat protein [Marinigracilibium pacificum]NMM50466.1 tetratricopeptide repeat protein [Marinigracilibium pacificum]